MCRALFPLNVELWIHFASLRDEEIANVVEMLPRERQGAVILHFRYHDCLCSHAKTRRSQATNIYGIDYTIPEYSSFSTKWAKIVWYRLDKDHLTSEIIEYVSWNMHNILICFVLLWRYMYHQSFVDECDLFTDHRWGRSTAWSPSPK